VALAQRPARIRGRKTEDAGGHDAGLSCTREIRTMFSLFSRKIVADGGAASRRGVLRGGRRGNCPLRECFSEHVL